ncbi:MAG TPA: hypothetical protein VL334_17190 [Anaerolineae bacterium]|nr:hypothetical protein [Anaerolineae bacterium]
MITQLKTSKISWPLAATLLAWLLPVFAWAPLTYPGYFEFHSGFLPIFNLNDLMRQGADLGWLPTVGQPYDLLRGEGALAYRLAALLRLLGASPVAAVKWTFGLSLLAGALGTYGWARRRLGPWPALLASMVYTYWPLLLATIYVRGALAEAVFMGLAPWVLWAADAASTGSRRGTIGLALGLAAALWTQAGLALWLAVIVFAYILLVPHRLELVSGSGSDVENSARRRLSPTGLPLICWTGGLALGILGLLPVVTQHGFGSTTYVSLADHFVYALQFLLAGWGTGPSIPGPGDTLTFSLGIVAFGLAVLGIVLFRQGTQTGNGPQPRTLRHTHMLFALAVVLIIVVLCTTLAAFLWRWLPFLAHTLTYPWQLLLLAGPWLAWLAGLGGRALLGLWPEEARQHWSVPLFAGLLTMTLLGAYGVLNPTSTRVFVPDAPVAIFGDNQIALLSAKPLGTTAPGGSVKLLTRWQALRPLDQDYTVFFHAMGSDGKRWGQQDTMPQNGKLPTSSWQPGQIIEDQYQLTLAADAPVSSDYRYLLGLYQWQTGARLTSGTDDKVVLIP